MSPNPPSSLRLALPKGRMQDGVLSLLAQAGLPVRRSARNYRPSIRLPQSDTKMLKPQSVVEMLAAGTRDLGFAGADWVAELQAPLVPLCDTGLDPVRVVAAAPPALLEQGRLPRRALIVASEYPRLCGRWIAARRAGDHFVRSWGASEVLPPEDADCIVDNTATGSTLQANGLQIVEELMRSTTQLFASPRAMEDPNKRGRIESLALLIRSVVDARARVMLEANVSAERLDALVAILPSMRQPTLSKLHGSAGYALRSAVPRAELAELLPALKAAGATDLVVSRVEQILP